MTTPETSKSLRRIWFFVIPVALLVIFGGIMFALREHVESKTREAEEGPGPPVDLLPLIELRNDQQKGSWSLSAGALVSPMEVDALLQIPYAPPREYDLEIILEMKDAPEGFGIGLVMGQSQVLAALDSHGHTFAGLSLIDGKAVDENETTRKERFLNKDKPIKVFCSVRQKSVEVLVDGRKIVEWTGDARRLSLRAPWIVRSREALFLCSLNGVYSVSRMVVTPISGKGRRLR